MAYLADKRIWAQHQLGTLSSLVVLLHTCLGVSRQSRDWLGKSFPKW